MLYTVTVTETWVTTYTVEAPDEQKAREAFCDWAESEGGVCTISHDLNENCMGWDYEFTRDNFAGDDPDIVWEGGENNADR